MFKGTGVALVTPFDKNGEIDFAGFEKLLNHTASGCDYFVVQGTTGESATVSLKEKSELLQFTLAHNHQKLPVVFGIGGNNTSAVIEQIKKTNFDGVSGLLSVSPYYNKPSQEGIYLHFKKIAAVSPVPLILYNVPGRTSSNLTADTTIRLAQDPNIIGIKEASGNLEQCLQIIHNTPDNFLLISGDDMLTLPILSIGGVGVISVLANAFPDKFNGIMNAFHKNELEIASSISFSLYEINPLMYSESNPVGIKELLRQMGICENYVREPLTPASSDLSARISEALHKIK